MSNPVGFAPRTGPLAGLSYSTIVGGSSPPNPIGGGADPQVTGIYGHWYLRPLADLFLTDGGPRCSPTPMNASHADGTLVPYGAIPLNGNVTVTNASSLAADAAASASCEFVSVQAQWTPGLSSGSPYCREDLTDPFVLASFQVTLGGASVDLLGTVWSGLTPPYASFTPLVFHPQVSNPAHLLRPTALTWPGQDPDNQWNRAIWHRSEIGAITWTMQAYTCEWLVDAEYIVTGFNRQTDYPTPCPIVGALGGLKPGSTDALATPGGVRRRKRIAGSASTISGDTTGTAMPGAGNPPSAANAVQTPGQSDVAADPAGGGGPGWSTIGATYYNDPPPGAGNLTASGYHFAELGTARRTDGGATGVGWIARLFGMAGELPMGYMVDIEYGGRVVTADKQDRGYGQGGDGITSDPSFAIDLYDGSGSGLADLPGDLGFKSAGVGNVRLRPHRAASTLSPGSVRGS